MIESSTAALVAALVALVVGLGGALITRSTALATHRAEERSRALLRVTHIVELHGQRAQDRAFNLVRARQLPDIADWAFGESGNPYGPRRKDVRPEHPEELTEAAALLAGYGSVRLDQAHARWLGSLDGIEDAHLRTEQAYFEEREAPDVASFEVPLAEESRARRALQALLRSALANGRRRLA
ncbi:hypothetical protein [Clavibacter michiganensis]|uniref:hypothetical protein n=1 Tax=Clavibacter michiganensis TaxID=28447 RepID=UPI002931D226|nr:hypothetical protein [Clavibacter michiganensis]